MLSDTPIYDALVLEHPGVGAALVRREVQRFLRWERERLEWDRDPVGMRAREEAFWRLSVLRPSAFVTAGFE